MKAIKYNFKIVSYRFFFVEQTTKCAFEGNNLRHTNENSPCSWKVLLLNMGLNPVICVMANFVLISCEFQRSPTGYFWKMWSRQSEEDAFYGPQVPVSTVRGGAGQENLQADGKFFEMALIMSTHCAPLVPRKMLALSSGPSNTCWIEICQLKAYPNSVNDPLWGTS